MLTTEIIIYYSITWKYHSTDAEAVFQQIFMCPLPCDVTLHVSDNSLVSLLHGIVRPDACCAVPLLSDLAKIEGKKIKRSLL